MILRQVESEDYDVIKKLYEDKDGIYQWLWGSEESIDEENQDFKIETDEPLFKYTKERFSKRDKLYVMEENQVIGYLHLCSYGKGEYRIMEWGMFHPEDEVAKEATLHHLENEKFFRVISVCTPSKEGTAWLEKHGFVKSGPLFKKFLK